MKINPLQMSYPRLRQWCLIALISYPVSAAVTVDQASSAKDFTADEPPAEITLVTRHHSRILSTFGAGDYSLDYRTDNQPGSSFVDSLVDVPAYVLSEKRWRVPADAIVEFSNRTYSQDAVESTPPMLQFQAVGFPHIETSRRASSKRYKPFHPLINVRLSTNGEKIVVPNVACHGYSSERTYKRAVRFDKQIGRLAKRYNVNPDLVRAVIAQESCFRVKATSPAGAQGLMQLMPETAKWLGVTNKFSPEQNLHGGIKYLSQLQKRFETDELALAAYNAGPGNVRRYKGIPPFKETRAYVRKVMAYYQSYAAFTLYSNPASSTYN